MERYTRQMMLPEFGATGQKRLLQGRVLVVGGGGLGCPALLYLAAGGVGQLGVIDFDRVETSNLHRQILYTDADLHQLKAVAAVERLRSAYPETTFTAYPQRLDTANALAILSQYDVVLDGSDNFATRYLVNDACVILGKPLVYGAVYRYEGQVGVFNYASEAGSNKTHYRDLFPTPPQAGEVPNCSESGVLGVLPGIIGLMQANEVIKILAGIGEVLANQVLTYHVLRNTFYTFEVVPRPEAATEMPQNAADFQRYIYDTTGCEPEKAVKQLTATHLRQMSPLDVIWLDVREPEEQPQWGHSACVRIPLAQLLDGLSALGETQPIVVFCQSGMRSQRAARMLQKVFPQRTIYSLEGGIETLLNYF